MINPNHVECCDCMEYLKKIPDRFIDLSLVDPPYNVGLDYQQHEDKMSPLQYLEWCKQWFQELKRVTKNVILITPGFGNDYKYWTKIQVPTHTIIWHKSNGCSRNPTGGCNVYEPILYYNLTEKFKFKINRDMIHCPISMQKEVGNHPCPKPLRLFKQLIMDYSEPKDKVLDIFQGVFTSALACKQTGRIYYGCEIDETYFKIGMKRLSQVSFREIAGQLSLLDNFDDIKKECIICNEKTNKGKTKIAERDGKVEKSFFCIDCYETFFGGKK